ncbi:MAG: ribokinase [Actinobacteria bacterium]|nr:ribokinase [Actinomycetota bacterium]
MRTAVVGHVEWIQFARVERVPVAGEISHPEEAWEEPGGGGSVAAVQLSKLAGNCTFFTALGNDDVGRRSREGLEALGVRVEAAVRDAPTRRGFTFLDARGERTITTIGERLHARADDPLQWGELAGTDAVYFTAGDVGALRAARAARVLVATSRVLALLDAGDVALDAVVGSARDEAERYPEGGIDPPPGLVVLTAGSEGGSWRTADGRSGTFPAAPLPGPVADAYGCGDSFAGGLTYALGAGMGVEEALGLAARCGAACVTGRGPYAGQLRLV